MNAKMLMIGVPKQPDNKGGERGDIDAGGEELSEDTAAMAEKRAARDVMSAIKAGDEVSLSKALKAHAEACGYGQDDGDTDVDGVG